MLYRLQSPLERPDDACGNARGVPVHTHHRAEALKPERMREPPQELIAPVLVYDSFCNHAGKSRHAGSKPHGDATPMQR